MAGKLDGDKATFEPAKGTRKYLAQKPDEFSATSKFPPAGQKDYTGTADGETFDRPDRRRQVAGAEEDDPQEPDAGRQAAGRGASCCSTARNKDDWTGGRLDKKTDVLNTDGDDIRTKQKFNNYTVHVEFLLPYRPDARGQGRGNSGFYQVRSCTRCRCSTRSAWTARTTSAAASTRKVDPEGEHVPAAAGLADLRHRVHQRGAPRAARRSRTPGSPLKHNGVVVHDDVEINGPTGGARNDPEGTPGPLQLQGHGNPLQFRNIWIVEKK